MRRLPLVAVLMVAVLVVVLIVVALTSGRGPASDQPEARPATYRAGKTVLTDAFGRTVKTGWGTADVGGPWNTTSEQGLTVADGVGQMVLQAGTSRAATLSGAQPRDLTASVVVVAPAATARGSGVFVALRVRCDAASCYQASLRFTPDGRAFLSLARLSANSDDPVPLVGETVAAKDVRPGQKFTLSLKASGLSTVTLAASATRGKPAQEWQIRTVDESASKLVAGGSVSLWSYLSKSAAVNRNVDFDDLTVVQLIPSDPAGAVILPLAVANPAKPGEGSAAAPGKVSVPRRGKVGSLPVGEARYAVPSDAVFVDRSSSTPALGTQEAPYRSIKQAVTQASANSTIVVRAGNYHESLVLPKGKRLTVQAYPGEAVWLDGSQPLDGWRRSGRVWVVDQWTHFFDASPTYTKGAAEDPRPGWRFVNKRYPMAAHPDQLWVDGKAQQQVATREQVRVGQFFVDRAARKLVFGTDPAGREVRASTVDTAMTVAGRGDVVRGLGVRRYATSVWQLGAITVAAPGVSLQNIVFSDNATTGLSVFAADARLDRLTAVGNGLMGVHANDADRLLGSRLLSSGNNVEHFNRTPSAGGMKITGSADVTIRLSRFSENRGHGLWFDAGCADLAVAGNRFERNASAGLVVEISSGAVVAGNLVQGNILHGVWIIDTDRVEVANNTIVGNGHRGLNVVMDNRWKASHGIMPWIIRDVAAFDNVVSGPPTSCLICVEDHSGLLTPDQMSVSMDHNLYHRPDTGRQAPVALWPSGHAQSARYHDLEGFRSATDQATNSTLDVAPDPAVLTSGQLAARTAAAGPAPAGLSPKAAAVLGRRAGVQHRGAWVD